MKSKITVLIVLLSSALGRGEEPKSQWLMCSNPNRSIALDSHQQGAGDSTQTWTIFGDSLDITAEILPVQGQLQDLEVESQTTVAPGATIYDRTFVRHYLLKRTDGKPFVLRTPAGPLEEPEIDAFLLCLEIIYDYEE